MEQGSLPLESGHNEWGNRLSSKNPRLSITSSSPLRNSEVWIEQVSVARPMVPDKDRRAIERKVFLLRCAYILHYMLTCTICPELSTPHPRLEKD
jgi:hypothetical protein